MNRDYFHKTHANAYMFERTYILQMQHYILLLPAPKQFQIFVMKMLRINTGNSKSSWKLI